MVQTFCTSGSVLIKAGMQVCGAISGGSLIGGSGDYCVDEWIEDAEAVINTVCRYNFITNYSTLQSGVKLILRDTASSMAAIQAIQYDISQFGSRVWAEDMINIQRDIVLRNLSLLRDKKAQDFIIKGS